MLSLKVFNLNRKEEDSRNSSEKRIGHHFTKARLPLYRRRPSMEKKNDIRQVSERAREFFEQGFN